ncbi:MAG: MMPL family transporter [Chloroflexi bacterium]|nr:MMPL family transporter [Chloroflexota bacterium]
MTGFFPTLGDLVARLRWVILALWIIFAGVSAIGASHVKGELISGGINVPGNESDRGGKVLEEEFDRVPTRTAAAIFTSSTLTVDDPKYKAAVEKALGNVKNVDGVSNVLSFYSTGFPRLVSQDRHTTYAPITFAGDEEEAKAHIPTVRDALRQDLTDLDSAYIIGFPAVSYDISDGSAEDLHKAELYSLPLTVFLLLVVFGTVLAAGLPVILGAAAVVAALGGLYLVAQHMETSIFAMNTASMIGLGLGIDFSLLMVSRFREELARGLTPHQATVRTVATAGQSIVFSGLTVMLGLSVMLLYNLTLVRSIALGMLLVAGLAVLGAVTLLPALLCVFGRSVNALNLIPGRKAGAQPKVGTGRWHAWSLLVMRFPWAFLILSLAVLIGMAWPAREMNAIGAGGPQGVGPEAESRKGFDVLAAAFPPGEVAPISILIQTNKPDGALDPTVREGIWRLTKDLESDPRVARVESIANLQPNMTLEQFKAITPAQLSADPRQKAIASQYLNLDKGLDTYHISVVSKYAEVDPETTNLVSDIRASIVPGVRELSGTNALVTGQSALTLDYRNELFAQFPTLVGLVLLVTYVVLVLFFHSLILPLKAILMNLVGILASYGFLVMVFEWGILDKVLGFEHLGRLTMFPPVILFSILFGLSTDYEVFLLSRVKEIYRRTNDNEHSVAEGLERTAGIITAAGLIMIVVFGSFAMGNVLVIKELGVGLSMAVLLDSTIIRVVLVPASMKLMGHLNWWMPKALNWIPEISEGGEEEHGAPIPAHGSTGRICPTCGQQLPARARFCGRCGTTLGGQAAYGMPYAQGGPVLVAAGAGGETLMTSSLALDPSMAAHDPAASAIASPGPPGPTGLRRIPILIRFGNVEQRAWLNLRDCQVEKDPRMPSIPTISVQGLDVRPIPGQDPPELQIRNARVRF